MLSLILNRTVLLGVRFVGIFLVIMGLVACASIEEKPPEEDILDDTVETKKNIEPLGELQWWQAGEKHSDQELLKKFVNLNECVEQGTLKDHNINSPDKVGAWIHPYVMQKSWNVVFGEEGNSFQNSVGVSIVPYIETKNGKKYLLAPKIHKNTKGKFAHYQVFCTHEDLAKKNYLNKPHYYPTILLTPDSAHITKKKAEVSLQKEQLINLLQQNKWVELTSSSVQLEDISFLSLGELLIKLVEKKDKIVTFLKDIKVPFALQVDAKGFIPTISWIDMGTPPMSASETVPNNLENTKLQQNQSNSTPVSTGGGSTAEPVMVQPTHTVKVTLPKDFVNMFKTAKPAKLELTDYMQLGDCAKFQPTSTVTFTTTCSRLPYSLTIEGFKFDDNKNASTDMTIFTPTNISTKRIAILPQGKYYAYYNSRLFAKCDIYNPSQSFPYECIGKPLSFRVNRNVSHCTTTKKTISLEHIVLNKLSQLPLDFSCYIDFTLPSRWGQSLFPSATECRQYDKTQRKLSCPLSADDIRTGRKNFKLKMGTGWEDVKISVDINDMNKGKRAITAQDLIPQWPFSVHDSWWKKKYNNQSKSCEEQLPHYAIQSVVYSYQGTNPAQPYQNINMGKVKLPSLQEAGWPTGSPLPDAVTITLKKENSHEAKAKKYRDKADITWKLSEVKATPWTLAHYRDILEKKPIQVSLSTRITPDENYGIYQFQTMASCRKPYDGTSINRLSQYTQYGQQLTIPPCAESNFFKLIDELNGKPVSRCTRINVANKLAFRPSECPGKRKLVVIAQEGKLNQYHEKITSALVSAFQQYSNQPFTLVTISPGRELSGELFRCEDMPGGMTVAEIRRPIRRKLKTILRFGGRDLDAWQNLEIVDLEYQNKLDNLAGIFYVTAGTGQSDIYKYIGFPMKWKRANVPLTVITTGSCQKWRDNQIRCQPISEIGDALETFLKPQ